MDKIIQSDLYRYNGLKGISGFFKGLKYPGFRYMFFFRKTASTSKRSLFGIFYRLMLSHYKYKYGFQIPAGTKIGKGFFIGHFGHIIINAGAVIGDNCNFSPGVTIGKTNRGKMKGIPVLGDRVWVGTGVVIVGNVKIGSDVLIAPNAYVNFDVPEHSIVIGNPGKIIEKQNPTEGYINNQAQ
jgi:serine O-acetyltransferase